MTTAVQPPKKLFKVGASGLGDKVSPNRKGTRKEETNKTRRKEKTGEGRGSFANTPFRGVGFAPLKREREENRSLELTSMEHQKLAF